MQEGRLPSFLEAQSFEEAHRCNIMTTIAFATYREQPNLTASDQLVLPYLHKHQFQTTSVIWDDPRVQWHNYRAVILRSCWDYHLYPRAFADWLTHLEKHQNTVFNPVPLLRWNMHKTYLRDLAKQHVPIPPTQWLERGSVVELAHLLHENDWQEAVVKPSISATAYQTWRVSRTTATEQQSRLDAMLQQADILVQKFVPEVVSAGEWSLIFFNQQYSHAVLKQARHGDFRVQDDFGGIEIVREPPLSLRIQAQHIVSLLPEPLLFARVDGVDVDGKFVLMELELIEPALFLSLHADAPQRFAHAILEHLNED